MNLTAVQRDLLWKVDAWARQNQGQRPSFEELRRYAMVSSTSVVRYNLRRLADLGLVTLVPNTARSVWLTMRWTGMGSLTPTAARRSGRERKEAVIGSTSGAV